MSNFTYEKYKELVNSLESCLDRLNNINENDFKVENIDEIESVGRKLISTSNSLVMYARHSRK